MFDGNVVVLHVGGDLFGLIQRRIDRARYIELIGLAARTGHARKLLKLLRHGSVQTFDRNAHFFQQLRNKSAVLPQQRGQQVGLLDLLILILYGQLLCGLDRLQRFLCIFLSIHASCLLLALCTREC